ncbi:hypothetical protein SUGI_0223810 [Cryptomeria japonica]|nr:hypothetical protein SUGI_0223810 [Cryptomeria japonica]
MDCVVVNGDTVEVEIPTVELVAKKVLVILLLLLLLAPEWLLLFLLMSSTLKLEELPVGVQEVSFIIMIHLLMLSMALGHLGLPILRREKLLPSLLMLPMRLEGFVSSKSRILEAYIAMPPTLGIPATPTRAIMVKALCSSHGQ